MGETLGKFSIIVKGEIKNGEDFATFDKIGREGGNPPKIGRLTIYGRKLTGTNIT